MTFRTNLPWPRGLYAEGPLECGHGAGESRNPTLDALGTLGDARGIGALGVSRGIGVSGYRGIGVSGYRVSEYRGIGVSGYRGIGVSSIGVSGYRGIGVSERSGRPGYRATRGPWQTHREHRQGRWRILGPFTLQAEEVESVEFHTADETAAGRAAPVTPDSLMTFNRFVASTDTGDARDVESR